MNHLGVGSEGADLASNPVVEPHTQADHQVRFVDCQAGVGDAVHPGHTHKEHVVVREGTPSQQGGDDRNLGLLGQLPQLVVAAGDDDAVARQYHGPLGLGDELRSPLDLGGMAVHNGLVTRQVDAIRVVELRRLRENVLGDIHQDRAGPAGVGDVEGLLDGLGNLACIHHQVVVLGDGQGNAGHVRLLEGVLADGRPGHLAGDGHHWHRVHLGRRYASDQVGRPRSGGCHAHAHLAGHPGVAVRRH